MVYTANEYLSMSSDPKPHPVSLKTGEVTIDLLAGVRAGKAEDLEALCRRIGPVILAWAHLRMRPVMRARLDPDEIVQEVWVRVLAKLGNETLDAVKFRAWIIGIARNVMFELSRKASGSGQKHGAEDRWESFLGGQLDEVTGVSVAVARRDMLNTFLAQVDEYGETERMLLVLHGLEGRSFAEVGEKLEMSRDAAAKRWQRLRARLEAEGIPDYLLI
ncbi:MAG: RNA polymerase sigma factor (sigma-70 family) [Planctomycetota bacterium]|jgi:RNA polymerase sigma factor (sigma-70 family)